jgi:3-deoxy-D-manno-octulosonic-acid transferase
LLIIAAMFVLYEVLLYLVFLVSLPFFLFVGFLRGKYLTNFPARMGVYRSRRERHDLWVHAVSVGEVLASGPVMSEVMRLRPATSVVMTTTTITGQAQARRLFPDATVTYFPFDFTFAVNRFLRHHQPRVFAAMETEIWPNATRLARRAGLRLILANGRISDRSFPRYRAFRALLRGILRRYDRILVREETDRQRFVAIGAPAEVVETTGNVKFDYEPDVAPLEIGPAIESLIGGRKVLILGSTREGEDELLLPEVDRFVHERNAFVIIAPRKPERFEMVAALLGTTSLRFIRRSVIPSVSEGSGRAADVLLLDTVGELAKLYRYATAAFVGGSLAPFGGHNPIEPAAVGVPVCFGPHMTNFREIAAVFLRNEAAQQVDSAAGVIAFAERMFDDERQQRAWSERARQTVLQNRGASARTAQRIVELLA